MHYAVISRSLDTVKALMESGAEFGHEWRWDIGGPMKLTPLHMLAVGSTDVSILELVLSVCPSKNGLPLYP